MCAGGRNRTAVTRPVAATFQNNSGLFRPQTWLQGKRAGRVHRFQSPWSGRMSNRTRVFLAVMVGVLLAHVPAYAATSADPKANSKANSKDIRWVASWAAAADSPGRTFEAQTVRHVVRLSIGGPQIRIRLSNLFGAGPVTIG